ncbi:HK97 gp10 family phage protein [Clostridioides sp. ZZV14-6387]|uniref:HK97 gp10 family phage protein n=1 Tax=Clostridioides sp. ZZV14-6387 TaxID=2811497 RepID=UPI001D1134EC|nr:HK97 gp10 family phage protein [Clostridioides sp. ZZV14-6387]
MIEFNSLDTLIRDLEREEREMSKNLRRAKNNIGNKLLRKVKPKTPVAKVDGGTARKSWKYKELNLFEGVVSNNIEYIYHLEYGHRTRQGTGTSENYRPKPNGISFVPGVFMLARSVDEMSSIIDDELNQIIIDFWN